jgi:hypothetical protein
MRWRDVEGRLQMQVPHHDPQDPVTLGRAAEAERGILAGVRHARFTPSAVSSSSRVNRYGTCIYPVDALLSKLDRLVIRFQ